MFLELAHTKLTIFSISKAFVLECYKQTKSFPTEERFALTQQIRRAALSVHLNIAEGCSRKSEVERKRFYEIARGSVIEIDAELDIAVGLKYITKEHLTELGALMISSFKLISKMIT